MARASREATFFHTPLWHRLVVRTFPRYRDVSLGATLASGVRVVVPLLEVGRHVKGLFRDHVSTFAGCYGGPIADGPLEDRERSAIQAALLGQPRLAQLQLTSNPFGADPVELEDHVAREDFTQVLRLGPGCSSVLGGFSDSNRRSIRKARRLGVTIRAAETLADYRAYYGVYEDSLRRWGQRATSRYPVGLFEQGHRLAREHPGHLKLWLAEHEGDVIAGAWVFYWNRHGVYWHGGTMERFFPYRPSNLLQAEVIKDACERGFLYYDFNPSGGHEGVVRFKRSFGAEQRAVRHYVVSRKLFRMVQAVTRSVGR
ncbi:MAG: lipid II:glycine glycyltransferase FemX [Acidobacteriota bacterium]